MGLRKGCAVAARATFGVLFVLLSGKGLAQTTDTIVNWASAAQGGLAVTSKTSNAYPASSLNDGDRVGATFGHGGGWLGKTNGSSPDWAQIRFARAQTINTVTVYSPQDNLAKASEPNEVQTFTQVGAVGFDVQVQTGSDWMTVAHVTGNKLVKRTVSFVPVKTTAIRVVGTAGTKTGIGIVEIEAWGAARIDNVAAASAHAVASASSSYGPNFSASSLNDGVTNGTNWGLAENGGWANSSDDVFPNSAEIAFPAMQVVNAVTLWTLQDNYATASAADDSTAFTQYGVTDFDVQVLTDAWVTVASVTGNNLVKRTVTFPPTAASGIRVVNNAALNDYARIVELQAWGVPATGVVRLTGMEPRIGQVGDTVTLYGENFSTVPQANVVTFNGVAAHVLRATSGVLQVTVPKGATTGTVGVSTNGWTSNTGVPFTVNSGTQSTMGTSSGAQSVTSVRPPQAMLDGGGPTVTSFSPASGVSGTTVTITGTGFSTTPSANTVYFGSPTSGTAVVTAATATTLTVSVPFDGNIGLIYVTVGGVQASSAAAYEYPPLITSFTPTSRSVGGTVLISGQYFNLVHSATFGGGAVQNSVDVSGQTVQAIVPTGALSGQISLRSSSGLVSNLSSQSLTVVTATPTITGINPSSGLVGTAVTITGTNFNSTPANNTVKFNGAVATVTAATTTSLTATVPSGATTGAVSVTVNGLTATGPTFTVKLPAPTISSFTPTSASRGGTMVIGGTNFSPTAGNNQVYFADGSGNPTIVATVNSATTNSLTVTVPFNAFTGTVSISVTGAVAPVTSNFPFIVTVPTPTITGFSPQIGPVGTSVTITGTNFDSNTLANNAVTFNGTQASVTTATSSSLTVTVPSGATSGKIAVTVSSSQSGIASQMATSSSNYTVGNPPIAITGFSPQSGPYGTVVTVSGISFGNSQGIGNLQLNGMIIPPTTWSDTAVTFTVPGGTTDGPITVVNGSAQGATTTTPFTITNPTPSITGFTPTYGITGDTITITGSNFSPNGAGNVVKFNGVTASVVSASGTSINALVPSGATSGTLSVMVNGKTGTSGSAFTVVPVPVITGITPASGPINSIISIDGSNFDPVAANNVVTINDVQQTVLYASATKLRVRIAISTQTGPIRIMRVEPRNPSVTGSTFTVTAPPVISKISPVSSPAVTQVTIYGLNFDDASTSANVVTFNGTAATVTRATTTELDVWVPSQATTGQVVITNQYGQSSASPVDNYAATWAGATASASSTVNANFSSATVIDGDIAGGAWGHSGGWNDATAYAFPDWVQVNFSTARRINDVIVYTLGDNYPSGIDPTDQTTFANFGATAFDVQVLQDSTWVTVASVTGNNRVKRRVVFMPVTTTAIRVVINGSVDGQYSRLVEVEAHYDPSNFIVGPSPQAKITSFNPAQGGPGTQVTINGEYFGDNPVAFGNVGFFNGQSGGQAAQIVSWSDLQIVATVPIGAKNGPITVVTPSAGVATSTSSFHYIPPPVTIDSNGLSPLHGRVYFTTLTITGSGFSPVLGDNTVTFSGAAPVNVLQASYNQLTVQVPVGAQTGPFTVAVTIDGVTQTATSSSSFTVDTTQPLDSRFQGQSPFTTDTVINPTMYPPGTNLTATVTMQNRGLTTWTSAQNIYLAETDSQTWVAGGRVNLPASASIGIGGTATFTFPVQVPATPGIYTFRWQMAQDTGARTLFGDEASAVVYVGPPLPDAPACVIQTSPSTTPAIGAAAIRWNAATTGTPVASYRVAISEDGQNWNVDITQGSSAGTTSATFNPTDGVGHYYAVSACEATPYACTAYVVARNQVSGCSPNPPNKPISLTATPPSGGSNVIGLTWVPDSSGPAATYFILQVANSASGPWTLVNGHLPLSPTSTSYTAPGNGTYYFEIAACNSNGECSTYTQSTAVTIGGTSSTCAGLSVSPTSVRFNVAGAPQQVTVNAPSGCVWTISSTATSWMAFSPSGGTGSGTNGTQVTLTPNGANATSSAYTGVLSIGGNGVTVAVPVSQDGTSVSNPAIPSAPALATAPSADTASDSVGSTAGQFAVDSSGNATYNIPIYAPRGAGGLTPSLSLAYNSGTSDGLIGWGWTLSGISSITPCRQTQEHGDGAGVQSQLQLNPANGEAFCLDGQRLLLIEGQNGAVDARYRLESDNQTLIVVESTVSFDTSATLPKVFAVYGKDGTVRRYGNNSAGTNAAILGYSPNLNDAWTNIAAWYQASLSDSNGNTVQFNYTCARNQPTSATPSDSSDCSIATDATRNTVAIVPRSVTWSGGEIDFDTVWKPQSQRSISYVMASDYSIPVMQLYRITKIHVKGPDGTELRSYTPTLTNSPDNANTQQVTAIQECASTICYAPTNFQWANLGGTISGQSTSSTDSPFGGTTAASFRFADVDGDGRNDVIWLDNDSGSSGGAYFHVALSKPTSQGIRINGDSCGSAAGCPQSSIWGNDPTRGHSSFWQLVDFNGDGRADLLSVKQKSSTSYEWEVWLSNGSAFPNADANYHLTNIVVAPGAALNSTPGPMPLAGQHGIVSTFMADFDGDGLPDLLVLDDSASEVYLLKPTGNPSRPYVFQGPYLTAGCNIETVSSVTFQGAIANANLRVGDFNGDGRADLVAKYSPGGGCPMSPGVQPTSGPAGLFQVLYSGGVSGNRFYFKPSWMSWPVGKNTCVVGPNTPSCPQPFPLRDNLFQVIDLNGDGLADVVFGNFSSSSGNQATLMYEINGEGGVGKFGSPRCVIVDSTGCVNVGGSGASSYVGADQFQVGDYDGDGKGDVWVPTPGGKNAYAIFKFTGNDFSLGDGLSISTPSPLYAADISDSPPRFAFQVDLDGDGYPDTFSVDSNAGTWGATRFVPHHKARNVITKITSGLGAITEIDYAPLTFSSVYDREYDYNSTPLASGWGAPVQNILSARYVVQYVDSSAPTAADQVHKSLLTYRYGGYKVQGFGRGPLGFHKIYTLDQQTDIATVTTYNQAFPLTGTPAQTESYADSDFGADVCLNSGADSTGCMAYGATTPTFSGQLLSQTQDTWQWHLYGTAGFGTSALPSPGMPILIERTASQALKYEINDGTLLSASAVTFDYDSSAQSNGNLLGSTTKEYDDASMSAPNPLRSTTLTNTYKADDTTLPHWYLGRLATSKTVVNVYSGITLADTNTRTSSFDYDSDTGLLAGEHLLPAGSPDQALDKYHVRDGYGNETQTITCSTDAACSVAGLSASSVTFNSTTATRVQRYVRSTFDAHSGFPAGVYPNAAYAPFSNGATGATEQQTLNVISRDAFGNVTDGTDVHGNETLAGYGALGRQYFAATSTGGATLTVYRWCSGHAPAGQASVPCPSNAVYRVNTSYNTGGTARAPETWTYFDLLARPVLTVTQGFAANQYFAASKDYDELGRVSHVSEPYPTYAPTASNVGAGNGATVYYTTTQYDVLGRVVQLTHPNSSVTTTGYSSLSSTVTLPANASGIAETKTQTRNRLGQLVTVTDYNGSTLTNAYDASGNALTVTRNGFDGKTATATMSYDALGRKLTLSDPDLGTWSYAYNALGEAVQQKSGSTCATTRYDGQGRVFAKTTYPNATCSGTADSTATWSFDTGAFDTTSIPASCSNTGIVGLGNLTQASGTDNSTTTTRSPQYDCFGRVSNVVTTIGSASYTQRSTYDQFGRPFQSFFSGAGLAETGELYLYNAQGYAYQAQDGENGTSGQIYRTITAMDARGNVTGETRANNAALTVARTYDPQMGWLTAIKTGGGTVQNLSYSYDALGNQYARGDSSGTPAPGASLSETFSYDGLQRLTAQSGSAATSWSYDSFGNPTAGNPTYGTKDANCNAANETTPGIDALSAVNGLAYCYDAHGNQTRVLAGATAQQSATYTADDKLRQVQTNNSVSAHTTGWAYGPERGRVVRLDYAGSTPVGTPRTTHYAGDAEVLDVGTTGVTIKRYLPGLILTQNSTGTQFQYLFTDNLGSTHRITDQAGGVLGAQRFGAFGARTDTGNDSVLDQATSYNFDASLTRHGYTGHEQMDESGLIHMGGRIYSPGTMRFTQADPFVPDASDLQSYNRYSYVLNNPLVHSDPSGYWGKKEQGYLRMAAAIAITVVSAGSASQSMGEAAAYNSLATSATAAGDTWGAAAYAASASAATANAAMTTIASGYLSGFVSAGNLNGAVMGALSAGVNFEIGGITNPYANVATHAAVGGVLEVLNGGKFGHGFVSAGLSAAINPHIPEAVGSNQYVQGISASIVGGTISQVTGGKFANGAMSAAFEFAFNSLLHPNNTIEADVQQAIMKGDIGELRTALGQLSEVSSQDLALVERNLKAMETLESGEARMLAERYGLDYGNKLKHIFENKLHDHGLERIVETFGSESRAFMEVQKAVDALNLPSGIIRGGGVSVRVGVAEEGTVLTVRGFVEKGLVKISTIFQ